MNPVESGYGGQQAILNQIGVPPKSPPSPDTGGTLPFTGLDVGLLVIGALVLVLIGMALRRVAIT